MTFMPGLSLVLHILIIMIAAIINIAIKLINFITRILPACWDLLNSKFVFPESLDLSPEQINDQTNPDEN